jgi:uncharacterized membrane protein YraQ (UPF0718 family)
LAGALAAGGGGGKAARAAAVARRSGPCESGAVRCVAALFLAAVAANAGPAAAQEAAPPDFCRALDAIADEARRSGKPQNVSVVQDGDFMTFACTHRKTRSGHAFWEVAARTVSWEFTHVFPWMVADCLVKAGVQPQLQRTNGYTGLVGRNRIVGLRAMLGGAVRLGLAWEPYPDGAAASSNHGIYRLKMRRFGPARKVEKQ